MDLPPDLARIGDELAAATVRALDRRRRRQELLRRAAVTAAAAALALAALAPSALGPAVRAPDDLEQLMTSSSAAQASVPVACDHPRGTRFGMPACGTAAPGDGGPPATAPHRPYPWRG